MADVQTLYQILLRRIHQDASAANQKTTDSILRVIAESLRYHRTIQTYFNTGPCVIQLESDKSSYNLPEDFLGVIGTSVYHVDSLTSTFQRELLAGGYDFIQQIRPDDYLIDGGSSTGEHNYYAIDIPGLKIYVGRTSGYLKFRYLKDMGVIEYKHDGSNWAFYIPKTDTTITSASTYTNPWFVEGFDALTTRCEYYLWSREFGGTEESMSKATLALGQWQDEIQRLKTESSMKNKMKIRNWI